MLKAEYKIYVVVYLYFFIIHVKAKMYLYNESKWNKYEDYSTIWIQVNGML